MSRLILAIGLSVFVSLPVGAAVQCNISGTSKTGIEFSLYMEQPGADKSNRELIAEQVEIRHVEDDDYYPDELGVRQPDGSVKGYSAKHCVVRLSQDKKGNRSSKSVIRCAGRGWDGAQLQGVYYRYETLSHSFVCEKNCGSAVPEKLTEEDCNSGG